MRLTYLVFILLLFSCENDIKDVNAAFAERETNVEIATDIKMTYSDSAIVRVTVLSPIMVKHLEDNKPYEEYPEGLYVEFYNDYGVKQGQVSSKYGLRYADKNQVILQDSVVWLSIRNEKLESDELIWDDARMKGSLRKKIANLHSNTQLNKCSFLPLLFVFYSVHFFQAQRSHLFLPVS